MWNGPSALRNIDQTLQTIRNEVVRLDSQLSRLTESLTTHQRQKLKIVNDIATVRLVELESGGLQAQLSAADINAQELMDQRAQALEQLAQEIDHQNAMIAQAEVEREALLVEMNGKSERIVQAETQVQSALRNDSEYIALFEIAQQADAIAGEAIVKAEDAQKAMAEKAEPYLEDGLFMYLWERKFGTTEYQGRLVSRWIDGWVAGVINYEDARVNFWNLSEIPKRLQQHADFSKDSADESKMNLQQLELDALKAAGVEALEQELNDYRQKVDEHDDKIESLENQLNSNLDRRADFVAGEDAFIKKAVERLSQALTHEGLDSIHRYVRHTTSPTDDQLVLELQNIESSLQRGKGDLGAVRKLHDNKLNKLKELEQVRRNFKDSRFDDVRSGFGNESLLADVLSQFLQGLVSGSDVWRTLKRNQRYQDVGSRPDFGSGGLGALGDILGSGSIGGRARGGSVWHQPKPRRGGGGFNFPQRSGSRRGGGFRTGGGI